MRPESPRSWPGSTSCDAAVGPRDAASGAFRVPPAVQARMAERDAAEPGWRERAARAAEERWEAEVQAVTDRYWAWKRRQRERRMEEAGVEPAFAEHPDARGVELARAVAERRCRGAWVFGPIGTGKTTLASTALTALVEGGRTGCKVTDQRLSSLLRDTFDGRGDYAEVMGRYSQAGVLVLDDLGKARCTEWFGGALYDLVDWRWSHLLPTIVTSQLLPAEWEALAVSQGCVKATAEAITDRLQDGARLMRTQGDSYRRPA